MPLTIEISDDGLPRKINRDRIKRAVTRVLHDAGITAGELSIAVVDDQRMQQLNRRFLQHDYPTDVLSFVLDRDPEQQSLEGQIVVSSEYAEREAARYGWSADDELLLYVIHGCLHLVGYDDTTPEAQQVMRQAESRYLAEFDLVHRFDD